jgi:transcriptional regulator with XRE-family HTH domain
MNLVGVFSGGVAQDTALRRWRRKHGFTQLWVAQRCGVSVNAVARWEQGRRKPTGEALLCLMTLTGIPAEALIFPARYLEQHPEYLGPWASDPPARGRPPKRPPDDTPGEGATHG